MNKQLIITERTIINLIRDDLINLRLVSGLEELGLEAGPYYLRLNETIFSILQIDDEDFFVEYMEACNAVQRLEITHDLKQVDRLARRLYRMLRKKSAMKNSL